MVFLTTLVGGVATGFPARAFACVLDLRAGAGLGVYFSLQWIISERLAHKLLSAR